MKYLCKLDHIAKMYAITPAQFWVQHRLRLKERERNIPAAMLNIVVIATLATALAQPRWFHLKGGGCSREFIGVQEFFYLGYFETVSPNQHDAAFGKTLSNIYHGLNEEMKDCVTPTIASFQRVIIALCFLAILSSLTQFFLDTMGVMHKWLKVVRRNAVGSILTVFFCVSVIGMCYYVSTLMEQQQEMTKRNPLTKIEVKFDISYFLISGAGAVSVLATAANLLRRYPITEDQDSNSLLDDYNGAETFSVGISHSHSWPYRRDISHLNNIPPPPPYTP